MTELWQFYIAFICAGATGWLLGFWSGREGRK